MKRLRLQFCLLRLSRSVRSTFNRPSNPFSHTNIILVILLYANYSNINGLSRKALAPSSGILLIYRGKAMCYKVSCPAVLIDFDGPICGLFEQELGTQSLIETLAQLGGMHGFGIEIMSNDPFEMWRLMREQCKGIEQSELDRDIEREIRLFEVDCSNDVVLRDGTQEALGKFSEAGCHMFVVSNNSRESVNQVLESFGIKNYFQSVSARTPSVPFMNLKPHPRLLREALESVGAAADDSVMIGDQITDVEASSALGIRAVGLSGKQGRCISLLDAGAIFCGQDWGQITPSVISLLQ